MTNLNLITLITVAVMTFSGAQQTVSTDKSKEQLTDAKRDTKEIPTELAYYCEPYPECSIWPNGSPE